MHFILQDEAHQVFLNESHSVIDIVLLCFVDVVEHVSR